MTLLTRAEVITIVSDEWMPYTGYLQNSEGYLIDIARAIFEKRGVTVISKSIPWARAVAETRDGKYTAIAGAYKTDAPDFLYPVDEQGIGVDVFFALKETKWGYDGIDSLNNITLGVVKDYSYGKAIDDYIFKNINDISKINILPGDNMLLPRTLKLLRQKRITAFIENKYVFYYTLKHNEIKDIKEVGTRGSDKLYIAFSPKNPRSKEYALILSEGMSEIRTSGELKKILDKYGLKDWK